MLKINFKLIFQTVFVRLLLLPFVLTCVFACKYVPITDRAPASWRGTVAMTHDVTGVGKYIYLTEDVIFTPVVDPELVDLLGGTEYEILSGEMTMTVILDHVCSRKGQTKYSLAKNEGKLITNRKAIAKEFYDGDISLTHPVTITTHCGDPFPDITADEDTNDFIRIEAKAGNDNSPRADGHLIGVIGRTVGNTKTTTAWNLAPVD